MLILYAAVLLFGLLIGSFLNVCIHRLPKGESIVSPPSSCPGCGSRIKPYHNIPVISYIALGGRCASCGCRISPRYPLVELLNALLYVAALYRFGPTPQALVVMLLLSAFVVVLFIDLDHMIIPNEITYAGIPLGLLLGPLVLHTGFINSLLGAVVGGGVLFGVAALVELVIKKESLGFGDVKLIAMIGAFTGWKTALLTIFLGSLLGSAVGITLVLSKKIERRTLIPFGPFLVVGAVFAIFFGENIIKLYFP